MLLERNALRRPMGVMVAVSIVMVAVSILMVSGWGQQTSSRSSASAQKPNVESLLAGLRSDIGSDRDAAFYQLRSNPTAMRSAKVRSALLALLDRENHEADTGVHMGEGEGYGEYFSDLLGAVESFADWNDKRQVCILVKAGAIPASSVAAEASARMKTAIPCLLEMSKGASRVTAVPVLVQALARAKDDLDPDTIQTVRQVILLALRDPDEGVRVFAVDALSKFGEGDMIPALEEVAANDPSPEIQGHSIRKSAAEAIAAIQKRAGQPK